MKNLKKHLIAVAIIIVSYIIELWIKLPTYSVVIRLWFVTVYYRPKELKYFVPDFIALVCIPLYYLLNLSDNSALASLLMNTSFIFFIGWFFYVKVRFLPKRKGFDVNTDVDEDEFY